MDIDYRNQAVPKVGDKHSFFDDGKMRESRHSYATVTKVITPEEAKDIMISRIEGDADGNSWITSVSLYDIWRQEIDDCRTSEMIKVIDGNRVITSGEPWCYAEETDYFVCCSIPSYDENDVWFVRHVNGGWFSMDTVNYWMAGRLMPIEFDFEEFLREIEEENRKFQEFKKRNTEEK